MPIINDPSANTSGITSYTLKVGVQEKLYTGVSTTGAGSIFGLPPQSSNWRGHLILQAAGVGATAFTSSTVDLEMDMSGTGQWQAFIAGVTLTTPASVDVSGCGGIGRLRLNVKTITLGAASSIDIYSNIG